MFALKPISHESVASAIAKAERYRLLNEPAEAESICRDILDIEPHNQPAMIGLVLTLSDQIADDPRIFSHAIGAAGRLREPYDRAYYSGIVWERRAKGRLYAGGHEVRHSVYEWIHKAMQCFEEAERLRPPGNDDAVLRWNTCVRFLSRHPDVAPREDEEAQPILSE